MCSGGVHVVGKGGAWRAPAARTLLMHLARLQCLVMTMRARAACRQLASVAQIGRELELIAPHALQYGLMPTRMQLLEAGRSDLMAAIQARRPSRALRYLCASHECGSVGVHAAL